MVRVDDDAEIPDSGAVFTFGKSKFADNVPSKFWIRNDSIASVACGDEHTIIVTGNGRVYVFGNNGWGQLGLGNTKNVSKPSCLKILKHEKACGAAGGRSHSLVATESGKVYAFGANGDGQLGVGDTKDRTEPTLVSGIDGSVVMVAAGSYHSAVLTGDGKLYVFGSNSEGQLGLEEVKSCATPRQLPLAISITAVACGYYHTVVIGDGKLYTFGEKEGGKLGLQEKQLQKGTNRAQCVFTITEKMAAISCGGSHTAAVTECGKLYTFGSGVNGQLGLGTLLMETVSPTVVQLPDDRQAALVSCGESHTAVVTRDGRLLTCGDGRHGKLALGNENFSNQFSLRPVKRFAGFTVRQVASGGCHMIVLASKAIGEDNSNDEDAAKEELARTAEADMGEGKEAALLARSRRRRREQDANAESDPDRIVPPLPIAEEQPEVTLKAVDGDQKLDELKQLEQHILEMEELEKSLNGAVKDFDDQSVFSDISQLNKTHELTTLSENGASLLVPVKPIASHQPSDAAPAIISLATAASTLAADVADGETASDVAPTRPKSVSPVSQRSGAGKLESAGQTVPKPAPRTPQARPSEALAKAPSSSSEGSDDEADDDDESSSAGSEPEEKVCAKPEVAGREETKKTARPVPDVSGGAGDYATTVPTGVESVEGGGGGDGSEIVTSAKLEDAAEEKPAKKESFMKRLFSFKKSKESAKSAAARKKSTEDVSAPVSAKNRANADAALVNDEDKSPEDSETMKVDSSGETNGQESPAASAQPSTTTKFNKKKGSTEQNQNSKACAIL